MRPVFARFELALLVLCAVAVAVALTWAAYAAPEGQCDPAAGAVVAVGPLVAGTPYAVPTEAVGRSVGLVERVDAGTPVVVLAPCP